MAKAAAALKPVEYPVPTPTLGLKDAIGMIVGIVVGAGIFRAPSLVAANVGSSRAQMLVWIAGGAISLIGALCYAELTTTYPNTGGDYHYLTRAYGKTLSFLFAWSRITVIQTGSAAILAFVFGDYASRLLNLGEYSASIYASLAIVSLTVLNLWGVRQGTRTQNLLTVVETSSLLAVAAIGLILVPAYQPDASAPVVNTPARNLGLAMVFVLLTYGGWNEAAYISAEMNRRRDVARALLFSIAIISGLYLLVNWALLRAIGLSEMGASDAVAADLMTLGLGQWGAGSISIIVSISALSSANATLFTGARTNYAFGRDFHFFRFLGDWHQKSNTPTNSLLVQSAIALCLIGIGTLTREGFATMVEYTAPVFWFFFFMTGLSLILLRLKEPDVSRPFRTPLYPAVPILFCGSSLYMLQASLAHTGLGALVGVSVLLTGLPVFWVTSKYERRET